MWIFEKWSRFLITAIEMLWFKHKSQPEFFTGSVIQRDDAGDDPVVDHGEKANAPILAIEAEERSGVPHERVLQAARKLDEPA